MGAVPVDLTAARAAVEVAASRVADLVRSLPDPSSRVSGLDWTVGQTAAHLVAAVRVYPGYATGQATPEATIDLAEGNLQRIAQVGDHGLGELADLLVAETQGHPARPHKAIRSNIVQPSGSRLQRLRQGCGSDRWFSGT